MLYFKNSDLAYTYHVSVRTVRNWIESAKQGKLDLTLHTHGQRMYVSNTARNIATIERLVEEGKKYRPHRAVKTVTPKPEFYELFHEAQIYDIVRNLEIHHELPHKYNYFDGGANYWDLYAQRLATEESPNLLTSTIKLLDINLGYIDTLLAKYKRVNIVDIGVGNALPVKSLLEHLLEREKLGRYVALDISPEMLKIARANINKWFKGKIKFEDYQLDITYERFTNILAEEFLRPDRSDSVNVILFLGGTIENFRDPDAAYTTIHESMGKDDLFVQVVKLDTGGARQYFDFNIGNKPQPLPLQEKFIIDLLGIDEESYAVETGFDPEKRARFLRIRFNVAVSINFVLELGKRSVEFNKGDTILLWRYWHQSGLEVIEQLNQNKFALLQGSETDDEEYLLTVTRVKRSIEL